MRTWLHEQTLFFREFLRNFHTTGAVLPSGRFLSAALARHVGRATEPQWVLEVGPGTGAVTRRIVTALGPQDRLDLVELNDQFVAQLRARFQSRTPFSRVADRTQLWHCPLQRLPSDRRYDVVVSGLPLNNFSVADVEELLGCLVGRVKPGGVLSFFEYIGVRPLRALVSRGEERARLRGIGQAMNRVLQPYEFRRQWVLPNVPPAWVHHLRVES